MVERLQSEGLKVSRAVRVRDSERSRRDIALFREVFGSVNEAYGYTLVGHGEVTNPNKCGRHFSFYGCIRVDRHNVTTLDGQNYAGKAFVRRVRHWCNKPSCPVCFKKGWAKREAGRIEVRLVEASKKFGQIEHVCASVPPRDYGLSLEALRKKVIKLLKRRGVIGGTLIWHPFRYRDVDKFKKGVLLPAGWYWSPHFHVLGFILGGYRECRECLRKGHCLKGCGFDDRNYQMRLEDGYVIKVFDKRKTVFGTAWYQLNHAGIKIGAKRFHVNTWFGVVGYRKLKVTPEVRKEVAVCPICRHELVELRYWGSKNLVAEANTMGCARDTFEDYREGVNIVWVERKRIKGTGG